MSKNYYNLKSVFVLVIFQNFPSSPTHFYKLLQPLQNVDINIIIAKTEKREKAMAILNKEAFDPTRGLNESIYGLSRTV